MSDETKDKVVVENAVDKPVAVSTEPEVTATEEVPNRPRIRDERGLGGRYIALGGGERELVVEDSTYDPQIHVDDSAI